MPNNNDKNQNAVRGCLTIHRAASGSDAAKTRSSATADGPRDALSVEISPTAAAQMQEQVAQQIRNKYATNTQQIEVVEQHACAYAQTDGQPENIIIIIIIIIILAHQHKACRQLKIKQEMTAVGG